MVQHIKLLLAMPAHLILECHFGSWQILFCSNPLLMCWRKQLRVLGALPSVCKTAMKLQPALDVTIGTFGEFAERSNKCKVSAYISSSLSLSHYGFHINKVYKKIL